MIYTSYYGNIRNLSKYVKIGISASQPFYVPVITELVPTWDIIREYKQTFDEEKYIRRYYAEILGKTSIDEVISKIRRIGVENHNFNVVLLCYEKSNQFCHRHIVAEWLRQGGYNVQEV